MEPTFITHSSKLHTDFGLEWANKLFGKEVINSIPVYKRGLHIGKPKGYVLWTKATSNGYSKLYQRPVKKVKWCGRGLERTNTLLTKPLYEGV